MTVSKTLTVLFGGPSEERLVSVASAHNIARSLPEATYWFWTPTGAIVPCPAMELLQHERHFNVILHRLRHLSTQNSATPSMHRPCEI